MPRTILVHLNVEAEGSATPDEVADFIMAAFEVGRDNPFGGTDGVDLGMTVTVALAEEV